MPINLGNDLLAGTTGLKSQTVYIGNYEMSMKMFLAVVYYILTDTNLKSFKDPRLQFVECIKSMKPIERQKGKFGNNLSSALESPIDPVNWTEEY